MSGNGPELNFEKLLGEVSSVEELLRKLEHPVEREVVRRASVLRDFDERIYEEFLSQNVSDPAAPAFKKLASNFNLERAPRAQGVFRVKEDARRAGLHELRSDRQAGGAAWRGSEEVFGRLLGYYESLGEAAEFDRLAVLVVTDQARARREFERLYAEADSRFDTARCNDLIRLFEARTPLLEEDLRLFCQDVRQYYNARSLFAEEFYQTTAYLERAGMAEEFARLLDGRPPDSGKWIYQVYATGGLGKTMFVRWLIARCCVPEPRRVPVATLDFDLLDLNSASQYPHLLLLPIAEQLDQQIARRPFHEPFTDGWGYRPLLDRPTGGERDTARGHLEQSFRRNEDQWYATALPIFCRTLEEAGFTGPIVIAIDTLEEMLLLSKESLANVIRQIEQVHRAYPSLRLVLSGRYNLREGLKDFPDVDALLETQAVNLELKRFTREEARVYLTQKRGLKEAEEGDIIEAVVEKCAERGAADGDEADEAEGGGARLHRINPFVLSLLANLYLSKDIRTAEEVKALPRAEVAYLIERIIKRIPDEDVRWILRYACVPRRLTYDLLEKVLWPHLLAERVEERNKDTRQKFEHDYDQRVFFPHGPASSPQEAWDKLKPFISDYGWVSLEKDGRTLRLHADVTAPMRLLLGGEEVYPQLHGDAARYFEGQAKDAPDHWAAWTCEAVYHRFQLEGPKAAQFWRERLKCRQASTDMKARVRLASELAKPDYVGEDGLPLRWRKGGDEPLVELKDLCEAHHEAAIASMMRTADEEKSTEEYAKLWGEAREHLLKLRAVLDAGGASAFEPQLDVDIFARLSSELSKQRVVSPSVLPLAEQALASTKSLLVKLCLTSQMAELYAGTGQRGRAEECFREALSISGFIRFSALSQLVVSLRLAHWYTDTGRAEEALALYEKALMLRETGEKLGQKRAIKSLMASAYISMGWYDRAERLTREARPSKQPAPETEPDWDNELLFNRLQAGELLKPLDALSHSEALMRLTPGGRRLAELTELRGQALGQLMRFKESASALEEAKELWDAAEDPYGPDRAMRLRIELQLDMVGNVNEAAVLLEGWEIHGGKKDPEHNCRLRLLRVRCLHLMGRHADALSSWRELLESGEVRTSVSSRVRVLAAGLALGVESEELVGQLCDALSRIKSPSARLRYLSDLRLASGVREGETAEPLVKLVNWAPEKKHLIFPALLYADLLRFAGMREQAGELLGRMARKAVSEGNAYALFLVLSALNRVQLPPPPGVSIHEPDLAETFSSQPALWRAALLEDAELALTTGSVEQCRRELAEVTASASESGELTKLDARAAELTARLAVLEGTRERAVANQEIAAKTYETLGDQPSASIVKQLVDLRSSEGAEKDAPTQTSRRPEQVLTIKLDVLRGSIVMRRGGEMINYPLGRGWAQMLAAPLRDREKIFALTKEMVGNPENFRSTLGRHLRLSGAANQFVEGGRLPDLRLEIPAAGLAKIPWELASIGKAGLASLASHFKYVYRGAAYAEPRADAIRWIQLVAGQLYDHAKLRVDGILGNHTRRVLYEAGLSADDPRLAEEAVSALSRRLWSQSGSKSLRALIVTPSFESQFASMRGGEGLEGGSLQRLYDEFRFDTHIVEVTSPAGLPETLAKALNTFKPQLLHVESSFKTAATSGQVYVEFNVGAGHTESEHDYLKQSSDSPTYSRAQLSATMFNDIFAGLPAWSPRPLVVFEAQKPPGDSAAVHQLLMRNSFASELFQLGNTGGVMASGLFHHPDDRLRALTGLLAGLSDGASLGDAFNASALQTPGEFGRQLSAPALFTNNPLISLIPI
jgi:tetratricopeptide (TPR) repeat protein